MKRSARVLARATEGELVLLAALSTACVAAPVRCVPQVDLHAWLVIGFALAFVVARRLDDCRRRSACTSR